MTDSDLTHYGLIVFAGDPDADHPDPDLHAQGPMMMLLACGPEDYCWDRINDWVSKNPLMRDETAEVVTRHPSVINFPPPRFACTCAPGDDDSTTTEETP